jgi:hypothetical protein
MCLWVRYTKKYEKYILKVTEGLFGLHVHSCTHWLRPRNHPLPPRIWAHIRGRYWSAKIETTSLCDPPGTDRKCRSGER